jgi:hypothetical protein
MNNGPRQFVTLNDLLLQLQSNENFNPNDYQNINIMCDSIVFQETPAYAHHIGLREGKLLRQTNHCTANQFLIHLIENLNSLVSSTPLEATHFEWCFEPNHRMQDTLLQDTLISILLRDNVWFQQIKAGNQDLSQLVQAAYDDIDCQASNVPILK